MYQADGLRESRGSSSLLIRKEASYRATDPNARYQIAGVVITLVEGVLATPAFLFFRTF